jgi:hypothetical protein
MRSSASIFIPFFDLISNHRCLFPALQTITAGRRRSCYPNFTKEDQEVIGEQTGDGKWGTKPCIHDKYLGTVSGGQNREVPPLTVHPA